MAQVEYDPMLKALVVSGGSIGRRHIANLRTLEPSAHITLWRQHTAPGEAPDGIPGTDRIVYSLPDALTSDPDLAIVAGPATMHVETGLALAAVDIPLLVEKPLSHERQGAGQLVAFCRARRIALMMGYNLRFYGPLQRLQRAVAEGQIGRVISIRAEVGQYLPDWRPDQDYRQGVSARSELGGGVVFELSHELDYVCWLAGDVQSVMSMAGRLGDLDIDVEDVAEILLRFQSGAIGSIHLDMVQRCLTRSCRVIGTEGTLVWNGLDHSVRVWRAGASGWEDLCPPSSLQRNDMYLNELRHFLDCVRDGREPAVSGEDGLRAMDVALAVKESARSSIAEEIEPRTLCHD
jgi:predicted dehydrogenase